MFWKEELCQFIDGLNLIEQNIFEKEKKVWQEKLSKPEKEKNDIGRSSYEFTTLKKKKENGRKNGPI